MSEKIKLRRFKALKQGAVSRSTNEKKIAKLLLEAMEILDKGYKFDLYEAKLVANDYIKTRFFHKDTELKERNNGTYTATDFASYGATVIVEPITIS